ncbi:helix-turn-helix domain-containing protein [Kocuria sp. CNJ-770]|uniref:helix-turn-helix domain-containing protein n=1 Tax=Kocuria sp. CNJ-770 TaxID=1904964 RepID=UPI0009F90D0A
MAKGGKNVANCRQHDRSAVKGRNHTVTTPEPFLTIPELAEILRCSENEARRLCKIGRELGGIQAVKHGKRWLVAPKALEDWAERHEYMPASWSRSSTRDYSRAPYKPPKSPHAYWRPEAG